MKPQDISIKTLILLLLVFGTLQQVFTQNSYQRQLKYWYLRDRLRYFVAHSDNPLYEDGSELVMIIRNKNKTYTSGFEPYADWGQESSLFGKYIGLLATEYYLLNYYGKYLEAVISDQELIKALEAQKRRDLWENHLGPPYFEDEDGLFCRSDVPADDFTITNPFLNAHQELNTYSGLLIEQDPLLESWNPPTLRQVTRMGDVDCIYEQMSVDEAIFTLEGLALAYHFGSQSARNLAQGLAYYILRRCFGFPNYPHSWVIFGYNGQTPVPLGPDCNSLSFGLSSTNNYFNLPYLDPNWNTWHEWNVIFHEGCCSPNNEHMVASLAAIGNYWGNAETQVAIYNNTDGENNWREYYLWLHEALQDYHHDYISVSNVENLLDEAPCEGPWKKNDTQYAPNGWATPDRWYHTVEEQNGQVYETGYGIFSGIDYMILLNLYYICNVAGCSTCGVPYWNRANSILDQQWPQGIIGSTSNPIIFNAFRSITSTEQISATPLPGDIRYYAGERIILKPNFRATAGSNFMANISPFNYCPNGIDIRDSILDLDYSNLKERSNYTDRSGGKLNVDNYKIWNNESQFKTNNNQDKDEFKINIFPNPTKGEFNVYTNSDDCISIEVFSIEGKQLLDKYFEHGLNITLDISGFSPGMYIVKAQKKSGIALMKIFKN